jgi:hypothetical protein
MTHQLYLAIKKTWRNLFIIIGITQLFGIAMGLLVLMWAGLLLLTGQLSLGPVRLDVAYLIVVRSVFTIAVLNLIGLPVCVLRGCLRERDMALSIFSFIVSATIIFSTASYVK